MLITIRKIVFHLGIPRAIEASLNVFGTSLRDSSVVLAIMAIVIKLKATAPAKPEKCLVLNTIMMNTNNPMTIEGKPVNTSFMKPETVDSLEEDHSEKNMPAPTPIGTEIRAAIPTIVNVPTIVLAIPPPEKNGPVGKLVKNPILMADAPRNKTSPNMRISGTTARTTATMIRTVINLLTIFRPSEIPGGRLVFCKILLILKP